MSEQKHEPASASTTGEILDVILTATIRCGKCGSVFDYFIAASPGKCAVDIACRAGCGNTIHVKQIFDLKGNADVIDANAAVFEYSKRGKYISKDTWMIEDALRLVKRFQSSPPEPLRIIINGLEEFLKTNVAKDTKPTDGEKQHGE